MRSEGLDSLPPVGRAKVTRDHCVQDQTDPAEPKVPPSRAPGPAQNHEGIHAQRGALCSQGGSGDEGRHRQPAWECRPRAGLLLQDGARVKVSHLPCPWALGRRARAFTHQKQPTA